MQKQPAVTDVVAPQRSDVLPLCLARGLLLHVLVQMRLRHLSEHDPHRGVPSVEQKQRLARIAQVGAPMTIALPVRFHGRECPAASQRLGDEVMGHQDAAPSQGHR